jgi:hypothetical protein
MLSMEKASKPIKVLWPIWLENGDPSRRKWQLPARLWMEIPAATGNGSSCGWSGFEEGKERKRKRPAARPEVAGRQRIGRRSSCCGRDRGEREREKWVSGFGNPSFGNSLI